MQGFSRLAAAAAALGLLATSGQAFAGQAVSLTKVGFKISPGEVWAVWKAGLLCVHKEDWKWSSADQTRLESTIDLASVFRDEMTKAGVDLGGDGGSDLFVSKSVSTDLQIGALVTGVRLDTCMPFGGLEPPILKAKGSATVSIEWQVYSVTQDRVIAKIPVQNTVSTNNAEHDGATTLIRRAFAANIRELSHSPKFDAARRATSATAAAAPAPPSAEIRLSLPEAARPIPLKTARQSVVSIFAGEGLGSGVLISAEGHVLTNQHVAGDAGRVRIRWADGSETIGEVVRSNRRRDVALVKTTPPAVEPLPIRRSGVDVGETVYAIGTPLDKELSGTLTRGIVSAHRVTDGLSFIQSDVAVDHGNSGGPMLDEQGRIVALTVSRYEADGVGHNINFFIPIQDALNTLAILAEVSPKPAVAAGTAPARAAGKRR